MADETPPDPIPGKATSELLLAVMAGIPQLITSFATTNTAVQCTALGCVAAMTCTYIWSRTKVKVG